jgi:DNA-binding transcriptional LysR family regulator
MDRLEAMAVFVAAADEGSLSGAGRRLRMPLPSVSRKLADLERQLGTRLMTRTTRQLSLTDAGRDYLSACRDILERVDEADRTVVGVHANPRGELVVAAPLVFGRLHVLPVVAGYLERHAEVNVRLLLSDRNANLIEDHVDVAVRIGALPDSGLTARTVGLITRVVCASPVYLEQHGVPNTPDDLRVHQCVTFEGLASSSAWSFSDPSGTRRVPIRSRLVVNTADAAIAAAERGVGITRVLSYQVAEQIRRGTLKRLLDSYEPEGVPVSLLYVRQGRLPAKTRAFVEWAAAHLGRDLPGGGAAESL